MNTKILQWWTKLTPTNKLLTGLAVAVCSLWYLIVKNDNKDDEREQRYVNTISTKNIKIDSLTDRLVRCEQEKSNRMQVELDKVREEKRRSDSINIVLITARQAVSKAIKNEKSK